MKRRPVLVVAVLGVLALGGAALLVTSRPRKQDQAAQVAAPTLPAGADPNLPTVRVDAAAGYAPSVVIPSVNVDYSYVGSGWLYHVLRKDW